MQILFRHLSPMNIPTLPLNFLLDPASVQEKHSRPTRAGSGLYEDLPVLTLPVSSFSSSMIVCVCVGGRWLVKGEVAEIGARTGFSVASGIIRRMPHARFPVRPAMSSCYRRL